MDKTTKETSHLSIPIPLQLHFDLQDCIPHGLKTPLFRLLAEDLVKLLKDRTSKQRADIFGAIALRKLSISDFSPTFKKKKP